MFSALLILQVLLGLSIIGLVLLQQGKGADMGAAFGSGASATVFGSTGASSFLSKSTGVLATLFFATSLWLAYFSGQNTEHRSVTELGVVAEEGVEVAPQMPTELDVPVAPPSEEVPGSSDIPAVTE